MKLLITIGFFTIEIIQNNLAIRNTLYCHKNKAIFGENICNTPHNNKTNIFFTSTRLPSVKTGIKRLQKSKSFPLLHSQERKLESSSRLNLKFLILSSHLWRMLGSIDFQLITEHILNYCGFNYAFKNK